MSQRGLNCYVRILILLSFDIEHGFLQSYVDFFYITTDTTPSEIQPSIKLKEDQRMNKRAGKTKFE